MSDAVSDPTSSSATAPGGPAPEPLRLAKRHDRVVRAVTHGPPVITTKHLDVWFGARQVLAEIDMVFPERSVTALIGPSGCGMSTFLRCLNRMHELVPGARVRGSVRLRDRELYSGSSWVIVGPSGRAPARKCSLGKDDPSLRGNVFRGRSKCCAFDSSAGTRDPCLRPRSRRCRACRSPTGIPEEPVFDGREPDRHPPRDRDGLPAAEPLPDQVDRREHPLGTQVQPRQDVAGRARRAGREGACERRIVERGQGPPGRPRGRAFGRTTAATLHRARAVCRARRAVDGRTVLGARSPVDLPHRGPDRPAQARAHHHHRHPPHAAGRADQRLHRVHHDRERW